MEAGGGQKSGKTGSLMLPHVLHIPWTAWDELRQLLGGWKNLWSTSIQHQHHWHSSAQDLNPRIFNFFLNVKFWALFLLLWLYLMSFLHKDVDLFWGGIYFGKSPSVLFSHGIINLIRKGLNTCHRKAKLKPINHMDLLMTIPNKVTFCFAHLLMGSVCFICTFCKWLWRTFSLKIT